MFFKKKLEYQFKGVSVLETPKKSERNVVYLVGEKKYKWLAIFECPCGCSEIIHLNLLAQGRERWKVTIHRNKSVTIRPSVWRIVGCKSHFTIIKGKLTWIYDWE